MQRIYVDTSVFGGILDDEFRTYTELFFRRVLEGDYKILLSNVTEDELKDAPISVQSFVNSIARTKIESLKLTEEAVILAEKYIKEKVVGNTSRADCYHIAIATINKADLLVSWNFKHIVNITRIRGYNGVNLMNSYQTLEIRNPRDIFENEN